MAKSKRKKPPLMAIIGSGYWGKNLVRNFHNLGVLKLVCDQNDAVLSDLKNQYSKIETCLALTDVLSRDYIEGVVISTPAETHFNMAREALLAGKHVYVEKPLVLREEEGEELIELARERNKVLMVGHLLQYHPVFVRLKELAAYAHAHGVAIEAEAGQLPSGAAGGVEEAGSSLTDPDMAARIVDQAEIDILAVSVGNVHVLLDGEQGLDLDRLAAIRAQVDVPLDLHGGTGIEADDLKKGHDDRLLFDDLSFSVPPGAIVGVIGGNGAGKTTLFDLITGKQNLDGGGIRLGRQLGGMNGPAGGAAGRPRTLVTALTPLRELSHGFPRRDPRRSRGAIFVPPQDTPQDAAGFTG